MARIRSIKPEFWADADSDTAPAVYWIYCICELGREGDGPCKIGIATRLETRLSSLQGGNWRELSLIWKIRLSDRLRAKDTEQRLLIDFRPNPYDSLDETPRLRSEWVSASPFLVLTRCVALIESDYEPLRRIA